MNAHKHGERSARTRAAMRAIRAAIRAWRAADAAVSMSPRFIKEYDDLCEGQGHGGYSAKQPGAIGPRETQHQNSGGSNDV